MYACRIATGRRSDQRLPHGIPPRASRRDHGHGRIPVRRHNPPSAPLILRGVEIVRVDSGNAAGSAGGSPCGGSRSRRSTAGPTSPPFVAWYATAPDTGIHRVVNADRLRFSGADVDTSAEIRAIKPPLDVPLSSQRCSCATRSPRWRSQVAVPFEEAETGETFISGPPDRDEVALEALRSSGRNGSGRGERSRNIIRRSRTCCGPITSAGSRCRRWSRHPMKSSGAFPSPDSAARPSPACGIRCCGRIS